MSIFRQDDEMEKYIDLKSLKITYWITVSFLLIWAIIDLATGNRYSVALALFCFQNILYIFFRKYYQRKLCEGNEE
jgi:Flp pilus assembly protein protease CpaA